MGMRTIIESIPAHVIGFIEKLRQQLCDVQFSARHRVRPEDFTRQRQLTFPIVMLFVLQKTVKSIQRHLHEFLNELTGGQVFEPVTAGAWTHARAKLKHTAFIELNQSTVLPSVYGPEQQHTLQRWQGHRLLGVDSSLLRLPQSRELLEEFGAVEVSHHLGLDYISRCSNGSFAAAQELFRMNRAGRSKTVRLLAPADQRAELRGLGLPLELTVRFVSVRLPSGELEVLATSLLDEQRYPTEEFLIVYHYRWNHETFYGMMKGRLDLENFSVQTTEAVRQDFFATLFLCNVESVLTQSVGQALREQSAGDKHPKQVNRAVAYHALKDQLLDLLYSELPVEQVVEKL